MKRTFSIVAVAALAGAVLGCPTAALAYCEPAPDHYSVANEYRRAKYVALVLAETETWIGEDGRPKALQPPFQNGNPRPWGFDPYLGALYRVRVTEAFKGHPPRDFSLLSENTTARFWLKPGEVYLVFVNPQTFETVGSRLTVDTCGNSIEAVKATRFVREVRALRTQRARSAHRPAP